MADLGAAAMVVVGLLLLVQQTTQVRITHPVPVPTKNIDPVALTAGPYFGVVLSSSVTEKALNNSGKFHSDLHVDIAGRRFRVGTLDGVPVVCVLSNTLTTADSAVATQILIDFFPIRGIVLVGSTLSLNSTLTRGSVSVFKFYAFAGSWTWLPLVETSTDAELLSSKRLTFADYNYRNIGKSYLASVQFEPIKTFEPEYVPVMNKSFWQTVDEYLFEVAEKGVKDVELKRCYNATHCLPDNPEVVFGLKAASADLYLQNKAYADFLFKTFDFSTLDIQTVGILLTAKANGVPAIGFRGASSSLDAASDSGFSYVASYNALLAAAKFVTLFPVPTTGDNFY